MFGSVGTVAILAAAAGAGRKGSRTAVGGGALTAFLRAGVNRQLLAKAGVSCRSFDVLG